MLRRRKGFFDITPKSRTALNQEGENDVTISAPIYDGSNPEISKSALVNE